MIISLESFRGMQPRVDESLLQYNMAETARNTNLLKGSLRPWRNSILEETLQQTSLIKTIYDYLSTYWFEFSAEVDIIQGPVANDTDFKRYYTGDGIPKKTNQTEATTGSPPYPINFYPMAGVLAQVPPVAALGTGGVGDAREVAYQYTVVTSWGEEGAPSPVSNTVAALQGQEVNLTDITIEWKPSYSYEVGNWVVPTTPNGFVYFCVQTGTSGGSEPTWGTTIDADTADNTVTWRAYDDEILFGAGATKRIYRTLVGEAFAQFTFVGSVAMGTTTYLDTKTDTQIAGGATLPSAGWFGPPITMTGLVSVGRFFAGFVGKEVFFCEPNYPHAWPLKYSFPLDFPIIAMASVGNTIVAGTEQNPYILQGTHPEVITPVRLPDSHPCISKRGMVPFPDGIMFPSNDGLYFVSGGSGRVITKESYATEDWKKLHPQTWHADRHDGRYFAFFDDGAGDKGGVIIDMSGEISMLDFYATAMYVDPKTDTLYYNLETP